MSEFLPVATLLLTAAIMALLLFRSLGQSASDGIPVLVEVKRIEPAFRDELRRLREEVARTQKENREEVLNLLAKLGGEQTAHQKRLEERFAATMKDFAQTQKSGLDTVAAGSDRLTAKLEERLALIQRDNNDRLKEMRETVDEKLQSTLEKRLAESFTQVSERLEQVHRGLGHMQHLAEGVGDLKRVLTNAKTRGILGEIQLEAILSNILAPGQYRKNVRPNSERSEFVEFAVVLPGHGEGEILLPIDSKFPLESYGRLIDAHDSMDKTAIDRSQKEIAQIFRTTAQQMQKYLTPGVTTDFGIMFLPVEGLYSEVTRNPDLFEELQQRYQVLPCGPSTLSALLSSIRIGFRTLAIERQSSEIRHVLQAVKTEFDKFGTTLGKVKQKIDSAGDELDTLVGTRTRQIQRRLYGLEELSASEAMTLIEADQPVGPDGA